MAITNSNIFDLMSDLEGLEVFAEIDGKRIYTPDNYKKVMEFQAVEEKLGQQFDERIAKTELPRLNADGRTFANLGTTYLMATPEMITTNRYRKNENGTYDVVLDERAIQEQSKGDVYKRQIIAYTIEKKAKKLVVTGIKHINKEEFINEFTRMFGDKTMLHVLSAISSSDLSESEKDEII